MQVQLHPDLEAKLTNLAEQQGRDTSLLVVEAVERLVDHDSWFFSEVEKGLADIEAGKTLAHKEVGESINRYISENRCKLDTTSPDRSGLN